MWYASYPSYSCVGPSRKSSQRRKDKAYNPQACNNVEVKTNNYSKKHSPTSGWASEANHEGRKQVL